MHFEVLVEEPSAEAALHIIIPRIVGPDVSFTIHPFQGKPDLLRKLPERLQGYSHWLPVDWRIVVLMDVDDADCHQQKAQLETIAQAAGLSTRATSAADASFQVLNRLAIEELEAWFFGDAAAIRAAYPGVSASLAQQQRYRNPDAIRGGTWEALERVLQRAGHHPGGLNKVEAARAIAHHLEPERNRSHSFQIFCQGLKDLLRYYATLV